MKLLEQHFEFPFGEPDGEKILRDIEIAGRVCYKSEDKITETSHYAFVKRAIEIGHHSIIEHPVITVRAITDRGVTHEIVRHRIASYSQESTRYCNYEKLGIKFIFPVDFNLDADDLKLLELIELHYNMCIAAGRSPQQARYFLPNGLKTEIIMTYNIREWRHFFNLRDSVKAHPQMKDLAGQMHRRFKELVPILFD
jgi:thymidylate synthase (FAD)